MKRFFYFTEVIQKKTSGIKKPPATANGLNSLLKK
jgi:hypothetical protein